VSAWRTLVKALYAAGGSAPRRQFDMLANERTSQWALQEARRLGLMDGPGRGGDSAYKPYSLTQLGRMYCEGFAEVREHRMPGQHGRSKQFVGVTWLSSLPRDVRIKQPQLVHPERTIEEEFA
jgi:hypothetical protein